MSRVAGLAIIVCVIVLIFLSAVTEKPVPWFTVDLLLVIAAYLLGLPSLVALWRRNGNGSG